MHQLILEPIPGRKVVKEIRRDIFSKGFRKGMEAVGCLTYFELSDGSFTSKPTPYELDGFDGTYVHEYNPIR